MNPLRSECLIDFTGIHLDIKWNFIEQDQDSTVIVRPLLRLWRLSTQKVVDIGGSFGTLSRLISQILPEGEINILEPYPSACAQNLLKNVLGFNLLMLENQVTTCFFALTF